MRVLVTGATGFVGLNIVQQLQNAGHEVIALLRPQANRRFLSHFQIEERYASIGNHCDHGDQDALHRALHKVDAVIHTAGNTSCRWRDIGVLEEANVISTRNLIKAARRNGVRRIVYTSSTATVGSHNPELIAAEINTPLQGFRAKSPYAITKRKAEELLFKASNELECIILNPAEVVGAWDHNLQWGRIVLALAVGRLPFVPPGSCTFSPASAVAQAHVQALTKGRSGQRYILGGQHLSIRGFIELAAEQLQVQPIPISRRPYTLHAWQSQAAAVLERFVTIPSAIDPYRMRVFAGHHLFDDSSARQELHYQPDSIHHALEACIAWYRQHGFIDPCTTSSRTSEHKVSIPL